MPNNDKNLHEVLKLCLRFGGWDKASFSEYEDQLHVVLSLYQQGVADILQGQLTPKTTLIGNDTPPRDAVAMTACNCRNQRLFSALLFSTELSA